MKDVDAFTKVICLQCSWIKRLYDENVHNWKIIPSYLIKTIFWENFKFYPCLDRNIRSMKNVLNFYKEMITNWTNFCLVLLPYHHRSFPNFYGSTRILKLTIRTFLSLTLRVKNIDFVGQIFHENGKTKSWDYIKSEYHLESMLKFRLIQLTDALHKLW